MASLHRLPGIMPVALLRLFLAYDPAYGRGIEYDLRAGQGRQPRRLRKPLVKAYQTGDFAIAGIVNPDLLSGRKVALLIEQGIVGNVHLAIDRENAAVGIDHRQGVVETGLVLLEYGNYYHYG